MKATPTDLARAAFSDVFKHAVVPDVAVAPGRVNLIGEHTDYNSGFVLPVAIDANVAVAFAARADKKIRAHSVAFDETRVGEIHEFRAPGGNGWFDYVAAVVWAMCEAGFGVTGVDMAIAGDVPVGAGLASSAALEMAVARGLVHASRSKWDPVRVASVCQQGENSYVGVNCGIMDQFAASVCVEGSALLLDCRTLEYTNVSIPPEGRFVVMDTGVRRSLAASEYNERRQSCEAAVKVLRRTNPQVRSLRDVDDRSLGAVENSMERTVFMRATHVVSEIHRPVQMADALRAGKLDLAGRLMDESHVSLRDLYQVSCGELDLITEIARGHDACFGARMTGAGFGGCAVALVARDRAQGFVSDMAKQYRAAGGIDGTFSVCIPSDGASIVP
jgi:galactokinase